MTHAACEDIIILPPLFHHYLVLLNRTAGKILNEFQKKLKEVDY